MASGSGSVGVRGANNGAGGVGVEGSAEAASGLTTGVQGTSISSTGRGVFGLASATSGNNSGVWGESASSTGRGVFGDATAADGVNFGVFGRSASSNGRGVVGLASATSGLNFGVRGQSNSSSGIGVEGVAFASSGSAFGVSGRSSSGSGSGVFGTNFAASGNAFGVWGQTGSSSGTGVYGINFADNGNAYGVFGDSRSASGFGVFSAGNFGASGTKSFVIDHPFDPENRFLRHYSAEGPEPQNLYNGVVTLDGFGEAWVELPDYFFAINRDPRYQLTCIGGFAPVYVADEIDFDSEISRFRIAGGMPGLKVSWEVKAIRDDPFVRAKGAPVEIEKTGTARGTYLHPELYGQPPERRQHHRKDLPPGTDEQIETGLNPLTGAARGTSP